MKNTDKIQVLDDRQQSRNKLSIWFGSRDNYYHPIKEVIANATDELINNFDSGHIHIELKEDNQTILIQDTGRGIPVWEKTDGVPNYELLFTTLFAGTKYEESTTTGTNGMGNTVINYTSEVFKCTSVYSGYKHEIFFKNGGELYHKNRSKSKEQHGTTIEFKLDPEVYTNTTFAADVVHSIVDEFATASSNKNISYTFKHKDKEYDIKYTDFKTCFESKVANNTTSTILHMPNQHIEIDDETVDIEIVLTTMPDTFHKTYLNLTYLEEGGSIHNGIIYGIREYMNDYCNKHNLFKKKNDRFMPSDIENSVSIMANVFSNRVEFKNQTKLATDKLLYREVALGQTKLLLDKFRLSDKTNFDKFLKHLLTIYQHNEQNQRAARQLRNKLTKKIQPISNRVDKLVDCRHHGIDSEIFITEGESAKGSIVQARDSSFQAAYPLRGKILNCLKASDNQIFKNETITDLIKILGCGIEHKNKNLHSFDKDKLRYGKIILANDADEDGNQIACLVITMFHKLMPTLIKDGHIYLSQTPLFQVKTVDDEIIYYFNEREKDEGVKKLKKGYTVSRNKGLGQTSKDALYETALNPDTRELVQVTVESAIEMEKSLDKWLGDGLDLRKEHISKHLVDYLDVID